MPFRSLTRKYKDQPSSEVFSHFGYSGSDGETWETPYEKLASLAKPEPWDFKRSEFQRPERSFPILQSYLNYTFLRLQEQDRVTYSDDSGRACFNTGLQTPNEKDIYASFYKNQHAEERDQPQWTLFGFFDSYSNRLSDFRPLPEIATYIDDPSNLVFDSRYNIEVDYDHLFNDNIDRLPEILRDNRTLALSAIQGAIELLKERVLRNYKIAIPHWYRDRIQLLLPLHITSENEADLAIVAEKDREAKLYRVRTFLTMDMAYTDARLITSPDREWLNP